MVSISMSPSQFEEAKKVLAEKFPEQEKEGLVEDGPKAGHIHTQYIDADYEYRDLGNNVGALVFFNEVKHGMYKFLSDDTIGAHLNKLVGDLPEAAQELPAALPKDPALVAAEPEPVPTESKPAASTPSV
jgi:hypothetical protein